MTYNLEWIYLKNLKWLIIWNKESTNKPRIVPRSEQNRTRRCLRNEATLLVPSVPKRQIAHSLSRAASVPILGIFSHKGPWQRLAGLWWGHYLTSPSGACKCGHKATWGAPSLFCGIGFQLFPSYKTPCMSSFFVLLLCHLFLWNWLPAFPQLQNPLHVFFLRPAPMSSPSS